MHCPNCGAQVNDGTKFCGNCGTRLGGVPFAVSENLTSEPAAELTSEPAAEPAAESASAQPVLVAAKKKKGGMGKILIGIAVALIAVIGFSSMKGDRSGEQYIDFVKEGHPEAYPNITYGQAFDSFFSKPSWTYFKSDKDQDIVEFSGGCQYQEADVTATIQFLLSYDEGTFETGYFDMNGVPQNQFMTYSIITTVFDDYGNASDDHLLDINDEPASEEETAAADMADEESWDQPAGDIDYYEAYSPILDDVYSYYGEYNEYTLYDLDGDGIKELITSQGTCNADWMNDVYTIEDGFVTMLGEFYSPVILYVAEDGNGLYAVSGNMGVQNIDQITKDGNQLQVSTVMNGEIGEDDYYSNDNPVEFIAIADYSLLLQ